MTFWSERRRHFYRPTCFFMCNTTINRTKMFKLLRNDSSKLHMPYTYNESPIIMIYRIGYLISTDDYLVYSRVYTYLTRHRQVQITSTRKYTWLIFLLPVSTKSRYSPETEARSKFRFKWVLQAARTLAIYSSVCTTTHHHWYIRGSRSTRHQLIIQKLSCSYTSRVVPIRSSFEVPTYTSARNFCLPDSKTLGGELKVFDAVGLINL